MPSASQTPTQSSQDATQTKKRARYTASKITRFPRGKGLPVVLTNTHRFSVVQGGTTSSSGILNILFQTNGLFQPVTGVTTHKPHYFNQMAALFSHYRVLSSKISVKLYVRPNTKPVCMSLFLDDDAVPSVLNTFDANEREGSVFKCLAENETNGIKLSKKWNAKASFPDTYNDTTMQGSATTNPTEFQTFVVTISGEFTTYYSIQADLEYVTQWNEQATVAAS